MIIKGTVEGVSTKFGKYSVLVNGTWYGTKQEYAVVKPNKGDLITFDDGGGKKYLNNVNIINGPAIGGGNTGQSQNHQTWNANKNLGVEIGHASNVAKDIVINRYKGLEKADLIGSEDWYTDWVVQTTMVYETMKKIRSHLETLETASRPETVSYGTAVKNEKLDLF